MSAPPRLQLHIGDYLKDTPPISRATWEHHGIYILSLFIAWNVPGVRIPDDENWVALHFGCTVGEARAHVFPMLKTYYKKRNKFWFQKRLSEEHLFVSKSSKNQSNRAKALWEKKKAASRGLTPAIPETNSGYAPTPTPTPTEVVEDIPISKEIGCAPKTAPATTDLFVLPDIPKFLDKRKPKEPAAPKPKIDPWKAVYERGKEVLGTHAGGQITKLRKLYEDRPSRCLAKIEDSAEHRDPAAWMARFLFNVDDGGRLAGEYVGGIPP